MKTLNYGRRADEDDGVEATEAFRIFSKCAAKQHDIYLSDHVEGNSGEYFELLKFLGDVKGNDIVNFRMANFGGACHTGLRIAHALKECEATVIMNVEGPCYSMGAILALAGDALVMAPGSFLMFHNYSTVESGKAGEVQAAISEYARHFNFSISHFCKPFLTTRELKKLARDEDVYIHSDEADLKSRLKKHFPRMQVEV